MAERTPAPRRTPHDARHRWPALLAALTLAAPAALAATATDGATDGLRDPLAPLPAPARSTALPVLSATLSGGAVALARLDGEWLGVGERRGGFEVLAITHGQVALGHGGQRLVLRLPGGAAP
jgi:hypothetical protein